MNLCLNIIMLMCELYNIIATVLRYYNIMSGMVRGCVRDWTGYSSCVINQLWGSSKQLIHLEARANAEFGWNAKAWLSWFSKSLFMLTGFAPIESSIVSQAWISHLLKGGNFESIPFWSTFEHELAPDWDQGPLGYWKFDYQSCPVCSKLELISLSLCKHWTGSWS